jgi:hypothetical protein
MEQKEIAKKMLPVITAIAEGKTIQFYNGKEWVTETGVNLKEICNDIIENLAEYRIKPDDEFKPKNKLTETQKHCRPFKDNKELIETYKNLLEIELGNGFVHYHVLDKLNIWVRLKGTERESLITEIVPYGVTIGGNLDRTDFNVLFNDFEFLDGSPCGCWR